MPPDDIHSLRSGKGRLSITDYLQEIGLIKLLTPQAETVDCRMTINISW
ncbi:MAG: hypothetical protein HKN69_04980 [Desulfofustis sp.]|nr:hypothetical protein [Desulfofustis sp.]